MHRDQPAVLASHEAHARGDLGRPGGSSGRGSWLSIRAIIHPSRRADHLARIFSRTRRRRRKRHARNCRSARHNHPGTRLYVRSPAYRESPALAVPGPPAGSSARSRRSGALSGPNSPATRVLDQTAPAFVTVIHTGNRQPAWQGSVRAPVGQRPLPCPPLQVSARTTAALAELRRGGVPASGPAQRPVPPQAGRAVAVAVVHRAHPHQSHHGAPDESTAHTRP